MLLADLVAASGDVAGTASRTAKIARLADLLRRAGPGEIRVVVPYLSGSLPQGRIGLGWAAVRAALGTSPADGPSLTLVETDAAFARLAAIKGAGSAAARTRELGGLFARATAAERDFLVRLVGGELRQGALEGLLADAVARAADVPASDFRRALLVAGDLATVAEAALTEGAPGLARFALTLLRPVQPMLAQPAEDMGDALAQLGEAALEWKLDGARVQVHKDGPEVRAFSRRMNDITAAVPEIVEAVRALPARQFVLDGEAIALRPDGAPHPFQVTMKRIGRKLDVERARAELPLSAFFFDALHVDGRDLLDRPTDERVAALADIVPADLRVPRLVTADEAQADLFLSEALARGHEGVMAKALRAPYEAGSRGSSWLKVKEVHTFDLVVLAAEWGHGRRSGTLSNLHLGARDPQGGGFVMLGKTFKGLTDALLAWQTERLLALEVARDDYTVYVRPELVVEVAIGDVQESPQYPAGLALRFARVRRYREDKTAAEADTIVAVRAVFDRRRDH